MAIRVHPILTSHNSTHRDRILAKPALLHAFPEGGTGYSIREPSGMIHTMAAAGEFRHIGTRKTNMLGTQIAMVMYSQVRLGDDKSHLVRSLVFRFVIHPADKAHLGLSLVLGKPFHQLAVNQRSRFALGGRQHELRISSAVRSRNFIFFDRCLQHRTRHA